MTSQRRFYRIEYPVGARPILSVNGSTGQIVELSEGGGRVLVSDPDLVWLKDGAQVTITFQCGDTATSTATLVRVDGDQIVVRFSPPIALPIIIEEQRLLIIQFPKDG